MLNGKRSVLRLMKHVCRHPSMFAGTPEAAHGMLVALGAIMLADSKDDRLNGALKEVHRLVREVTKDVPQARFVPPMLCDESSYPDHRVSHRALSNHGNMLVERIIARLRQVRDAAAVSNMHDSEPKSITKPTHE